MHANAQRATGKHHLDRLESFTGAGEAANLMSRQQNSAPLRDACASGSTSLRALVWAATLLTGLAIPCTAMASQNGSAWPELLADPTHSSYSTDSQISTSSSLGVKWMANIFNSALDSPVVAYNATLGKNVVYIGTQRADVFAIDAATGNILWSTNLGVNDKMNGSPLVAPDGSVWVETGNNAALYKLNGATGAVECSQKTSLPIDASPLYASPPGGVPSIFWATVDSPMFEGPTMSSNEGTCSTIWTFLNYLQPSSAGVWASPAYGLSATGEPLVFVGTADSDSTEYAIDANTGARVWDYSILNPPPGAYDIGDAATLSPPGVNGFSDGALYVNTKYGYEYALDMTTGALLWQFQIAPGTPASSSRSSAAIDGINLVFGYGQQSGFGGGGGVYGLNAVTGSVLWNWTNPNASEVLSSPAIVGPPGSEVVAFGDIGGVFRTLSLTSGSPLYSYQTGGYITSSPAEATGQIYISSSDGFLYAFGAGGGNGALPASAVTSPANQAVLANPNGSITISGTATDATGVQDVEVAVQSSGTSGPWYNAATGTYNSAPIRNEATLATPGATSTNWTLTLPIPAGGGTYTAFASAVNVNNLVNKSAISAFTVSPSNTEPDITVSANFVAPGTSFLAKARAFQPGETVVWTLFGKTVATRVAQSNGFVPNSTIAVSATAAFGPTSLTATGQTSGKMASAPITVTNNWPMGGHDPTRTGLEANDLLIAQQNSVGNNTVLNQSWYFASTAPVNSSPAVSNGNVYFGNDSGVLTAVVANTGAPAWTYTTPSGAPIRSAPAIEPTGNIEVASTDGTLYTVSSTGTLINSLALGGTLTSPAVRNEAIYLSSSSGELFDVNAQTNTVTWSSALSGSSTSAPAYDPVANIVVVGDNSGAATAFNGTTGALIWKATTGGAIAGSPSISGGTAYIGSADGNLYAFNEKSGALEWKYRATASIVTGPSIHSSGVTIGDSAGLVYLISTTGALQYFYNTKTHSPIVAISNVPGNTMVSMANGEVGMIRPGGPVPFAWSFQTKSTLSTTPAIVDGTVYIGAADGGMYAFTPQGANPLAKFRGAIVTVTDGWNCSTTPATAP